MTDDEKPEDNDGTDYTPTPLADEEATRITEGESRTLSSAGNVIDWNDARKKHGRVPAPDPAYVAPDATLLPEGNDYRLHECRHENVLVNEKTRETTCRECDTVLDPVWVLMRYAIRERRFTWNREVLIREQKALEESIEKLKREKSTLRRGIARDPMVKRIAELEKQAAQHASTAAAHVWKWHAAYELMCDQLRAHGIEPKKLPKKIADVAPAPTKVYLP